MPADRPVSFVVLSHIASLDSSAEAGIRLDQQVALQTERVPNCGSRNPTLGDQDLTQELPRLLLRLEGLLDLSL